MAKPETAEHSLDYYFVYDPQAIQDAFNGLTADPSDVDRLIEDAHKYSPDGKTVWAGYNKLRADKDLLPISHVRKEHFDPTCQKVRITSAGIDGRIVQQEYDSTTGNIFEFKVHVTLVKGYDGSNLNHGSTIAAIDQEGNEVREELVTEGTCLFQLPPQKYNLLFKSPVERTLPFPKEPSTFGRILEILTEKAKQAGVKFVDQTIK